MGERKRGGKATAVGPVSTSLPSSRRGEGKKSVGGITAGCWTGRMLPSSGQMCELQGQRQEVTGTIRSLKEELLFSTAKQLLSFLSFVPLPSPSLPSSTSLLF